MATGTALAYEPFGRDTWRDPYPFYARLRDEEPVCNERTDRFRIGDRWVDLPVAGIFEVADDGRIALWRDYFDLASFTEQLAAATKG